MRDVTSFSFSSSFCSRRHRSARKSPYAPRRVSQQSPQTCPRNSASVCLVEDRSFPTLEGGMWAAFFLRSSILRAINAVMLCPVQTVPQASKHLCPAKLQTRCHICCACQSILPVYHAGREQLGRRASVLNSATPERNQRSFSDSSVAAQAGCVHSMQTKVFTWSTWRQTTAASLSTIAATSAPTYCALTQADYLRAGFSVRNLLRSSLALLAFVKTSGQHVAACVSKRREVHFSLLAFLFVCQFVLMFALL